MADLLPVVQADREAAAAYLRLAHGDDFTAHVEDGTEDGSVVVQSFATHRIAHTTASDGLREAGQFLLARLVDHEVRMTSDEDAREWLGHVVPAMTRLRAALRTSPASDGAPA